jgi:molecular chaperone Hsp33
VNPPPADSSDSAQPAEPAALEIRTYFVRGRNALVARGDFSELFVEYYLHLADTAQAYAPELDQDFKEMIVALGLYAAGRPWAERIAWTLHYEEPARNFFATSDNLAGTLTGTLFTEEVRQRGQNLLFNDVVAGTQPMRRSVVEFSGTPIQAAESLFQQSEQRLGRYFCHHDEDFVLVSAQPDCDEEWLAGLDEEAVCRLDQTEELSLLEKRPFRWFCGCSQERMCQILRPSFIQDAEGLFGEEKELRMRCPRCGQRYEITRQEMTARA